MSNEVKKLHKPMNNYVSGYLYLYNSISRKQLIEEIRNQKRTTL